MKAAAKFLGNFSKTCGKSLENPKELWQDALRKNPPGLVSGAGESPGFKAMARGASAVGPSLALLKEGQAIFSSPVDLNHDGKISPAEKSAHEREQSVKVWESALESVGSVSGGIVGASLGLPGAIGLGLLGGEAGKYDGREFGGWLYDQTHRR